MLRAAALPLTAFCSAAAAELLTLAASLTFVATPCCTAAAVAFSITGSGSAALTSAAPPCCAAAGVGFPTGTRLTATLPLCAVLEAVKAATAF